MKLSKHFPFKLKFQIGDFVESKLFFWIVLIMVILNTLFLAMYYYEMPDSLQLFLTNGNFILTTFFLLEMILKIIGLGFKNYLSDSFNIFEALVVLLSLLEYA